MSPSRRGTIGLIQIGTPLTKEREFELHRAIADGRAAARRLDNGAHGPDELSTLRRLVRAGRVAEEELLAGTGALVKRRVNDLGFPFDQDELEAAGLEGLVRALRDFDPSRDIRFATYANYWISKAVFGAISHRVRIPERDLRQVIKLRRAERQHPERPVTVAEAARLLGVKRAEASRLMEISASLYDERSAGVDVEDAEEARVTGPEADWIIERLKSILGRDFEDFWMWTGRVMSLEELGRRHGITKQAMFKRVQRWRRLVESSDDAAEMLSWLRAQ